MTVVAYEEQLLSRGRSAGSRPGPEEPAVDPDGNGPQPGGGDEPGQQPGVLAGHADHRVEAVAGPDLVVELHHPVVPPPSPGPGTAGPLEGLGRIGVLHLVEGEDGAPHGFAGDMLGHLEILGLDDVEAPAGQHPPNLVGHLGAGELVVLGRSGHPQVPRRNRPATNRPGFHAQRLQSFQKLSLALVFDKGDQRDPMPGGQELHIVVHAQGAAMQAQARRIGGQHQDVQGVHGLWGARGKREPVPDLHGLFTSMDRAYRN